MTKLAPFARPLAAGVLLLVLIQAVMAGRYMIGEWDILEHGIVGNVTFTLQVLCLGVVVLAGRGRTATIMASLMTVLLTAQIGMGYMTRENLDMTAWHVPLGVAIFGLAVHQLSVVGPKAAPEA